MKPQVCHVVLQKIWEIFQIFLFLKNNEKNKNHGKESDAVSIILYLEITLRHGCYPVNLLHIFRTPFSRNTSGWLLLNLQVVLKY